MKRQRELMRWILCRGSSAELHGKDISRSESRTAGKAEDKKIWAPETAKKMLQADFDIHRIIELTGLSESEILQLKK